MGDFFHGWRRKIGVVMLVLACVFAVGWVRSIIVADIISWANRINTYDLFISAEQQLSWQTTYDVEGLQIITLPAWQSSTLDYTVPDNDDDQTIWRWRILGFELGEFPPQMTGDSSLARFCSFPYWSIVIPLTLLSAYLLLSQPRSPHPQNVVETVTAEGK